MCQAAADEFIRDGVHAGRRVASRAMTRHHRLRDLRLQPCAAAAGRRRIRTRLSRRLLRRAKSRPSSPMPARTRIGRNWRRPTGWRFSNLSCRRTGAPARHRLRPRLLSQDRHAPRLAGARHRAFAPGGGTCPRTGRRCHRRLLQRDTSAATLGRFDVVHLNNVLEHVPDPVTSDPTGARLAGAGGIICVNVPNDFSPLQIRRHEPRRARRTGGWRRRIISIISISSL